MTQPQPSGGHHVGNREIMIVLAYLPPLALVPLLVERDNPEIQWHARHGIVLMAVEAALLTALFLLTLIFGVLTAGVGCAALGLLPIIAVALLSVNIVAAVKGIGGERLIIPIISDYASRF
jgi:uncharacterized membrane protein